MHKLNSKLIIKGQIKTHTGLHIGGSKTALDIGGVDLNVIKSPKGMPFIPGSSLKGKLRSLLAKIEGSMAVNENALERNERGRGIKTDEDFPYIIELFGGSGDSDESEPARLITRDAYLDEAAFLDTFQNTEMELGFSDVKVENTIDRKTGTAKHPRQLERVPAGAVFNFELIYDLYEDTSNPDPNNKEQLILQKHLWAIEMAMRLLQDDYLGGQGSRGYGKISFQNVIVEQKKIIVDQTYETGELDDHVKQFSDNLKNIA